MDSEDRLRLALIRTVGICIIAFMLSIAGCSSYVNKCNNDAITKLAICGYSPAGAKMAIRGFSDAETTRTYINKLNEFQSEKELENLKLQSEQQ